MAIRKSRKIVADPTAFKPAAATPPPLPGQMAPAGDPSQPTDGPRVIRACDLQHGDLIMIFDKEITVFEVLHCGTGMGFDVATTEIYYYEDGETPQLSKVTRSSTQNVVLIGGPSFDGKPPKMELYLGMTLNVNGDDGVELGVGRIMALFDNPGSDSITAHWMSLDPIDNAGTYRTASFSVSKQLYQMR